MSGFTAINHGMILSLAELHQVKAASIDKSVRVVGYLHHLDILEKQAVISDKKQHLLNVDISLIFDFKWTENHLYQIIGEVSMGNSVLYFFNI